MNGFGKQIGRRNESRSENLESTHVRSRARKRALISGTAFENPETERPWLQSHWHLLKSPRVDSRISKAFTNLTFPNWVGGSPRLTPEPSLGRLRSFDSSEIHEKARSFGRPRNARFDFVKAYATFFRPRVLLSGERKREPDGQKVYV